MAGSKQLGLGVASWRLIRLSAASEFLHSAPMLNHSVPATHSPCFPYVFSGPAQATRIDDWNPQVDTKMLLSKAKASEVWVETRNVKEGQSF